MWINGLDETDNRILELLRDKARMPYSEIAEAVGLTRAAVRIRVEAMEKKGIIQGYYARIEPKKVPEALSFYLDLEVDPEQIDVILDYLAADSAIRQLYLVSGNCRIHAVGLAPNRNTLQVYTNQLYHNLKGVRRMSYCQVLSTLKDVDGGVEYEKRSSKRDE